MKKQHNFDCSGQICHNMLLHHEFARQEFEMRRGEVLLGISSGWKGLKVLGVTLIIDDRTFLVHLCKRVVLLGNLYKLN